MNHTDELLSFDPLATAERLTGLSIHDDDNVAASLGMLLALTHNTKKQQHLIALDDTTPMNDLDRYERIITEMGFEQVLDIPFSSPGWYPDDPPRSEHFYIYAHCDGLLLSFDTYDEVRVNSGKVYYCWVGNEDAPYGCTSGGSWCEEADGPGYWVGSHDCREALRHNINKLRANGTILPLWPVGNEMFLWLLHYQDTKVPSYDYKGITQERINMLPGWVREMIGR